MAKKIAEGEEQKESILTKISNFFKTQKTVTTAAAEADDEEPEASTEEEDTTDAAAEEEDDTTMQSEADSTDPDDDDDDDTEDSEDDPDKEDDDDMEVNGRVYNLKDPAQARAAIESLQAINAKQNELLTEAAAELAAKEEKINKTTEQVKKEIKSTFVPPSSKRSHKIGTEEDKNIPDSLKPKEGTAAANILKSTMAKAKANKK